MPTTLSASIHIGLALDAIPAVFADPRSLVLWDRSVARVELTCEGPLRLGYTFDTLGPRGFRSSYRIIQLERYVNRVELVRARLFRWAVWRFEFKPAPVGTTICCSIDFELKRRYCLLGPLLRLARGALDQDLRRLKDAIGALCA